MARQQKRMENLHSSQVTQTKVTTNGVKLASLIPQLINSFILHAPMGVPQRINSFILHAPMGDTWEIHLMIDKEKARKNLV